MLSVPAVRRVAGAADRPAQAAGAGQQAAAPDAPLPADPDGPRPTSMSPAGKFEKPDQELFSGGCCSSTS